MDVAEFFFEVDDPRRDGSCFHVLSDIIMIVLCGYLADCEGFVEVHDYALDKEKFLRQFLQLPGVHSELCQGGYSKRCSLIRSSKIMLI